MQRFSPRFRSVQFFIILCEIFGEMFYPNFREHCMVYGVMLVSMTTNMTARSQQKHLLLRFAMKA